jgi:hypothetical protein
MALVVAPMCHPQFSRIEDLELREMDTETSRALEQSFDRRQLESAGAALRREREQTRLAGTPSVPATDPALH